MKKENFVRLLTRVKPVQLSEKLLKLRPGHWHVIEENIGPSLTIQSFLNSARVEHLLNLSLKAKAILVQFLKFSNSLATLRPLHLPRN